MSTFLTPVNGSIKISGSNNSPLDNRSRLFIAGDTPTVAELQTIERPCIGLHIDIFKGTEAIKANYVGEYRVTDLEMIEDPDDDSIQMQVIKSIEKVGDADAKNIATDALNAAQAAQQETAKIAGVKQTAESAQADASEALSKYQALADNYANLGEITVDGEIDAQDIVALHTAVAEVQSDLYTTDGDTKTSKIHALEQADATMATNFDQLKAIMQQFIVGMSEASYRALEESGNVSDNTLYLLWENSDIEAGEGGDGLDETFTLDLSSLQ